jgi:HAMP domain-containing protein
MIVICEECGKKYQIDAGRIKGQQARFNCKGCGHVVSVKKPVEEPAPRFVDAEPMPPPAPRPKPGAGAPADETRGEKKKKEKKAAAPKRLGLRTKMFLLFFLVPILCIAAAGWLYIQQLNNLSTLLTNESTAVVSQLAEQNIAEIARSVAAEVAVYLKTNPGLPKTRYNDDPVFKEIAVQPVGETGYTALYELPDSGGVWRTWAHANPKIVGINMEGLKTPLGKSFPGFWKVYTGVKDGKESEGYYTWQDADGEFRDKYMLCTLVEGYPYVIAATTYLYEFTRPMTSIVEEAESQTRRTQRFLLAIIVGTLILIGVIVFLYGQTVTKRIKYLTDAAESISVGELETEIDIKSNDEIGDLGEAISRMQDSIRLSLERLKRRR